MSNIDTNQGELFSLCKEVYERTGWDDKKFYKVKGLDFHIYLTQLPSETKSSIEVEYPLYTSDHLLERMPNHIRMWTYSTPTAYKLEHIDSNISTEGDSLLEALLKLTIALSEAGGLNDQTS